MILMEMNVPILKTSCFDDSNDNEGRDFYQTIATRIAAKKGAKMTV